MDLFRTRDRGNAGIVLPLTDPVTGAETPHWLRIASIDSDAFQRANTKAMRNTSVIMAMENEEERLEAINASTLTIVAALVLDWSFEQECTHENVVAFLTSAPQIRAAINVAAGDRALFMNSSSQPSQPGNEQKPD